MKKIAIYTGYHFLEHSMTFVYRQLEKMREQDVELMIFCTKRINEHDFPDLGQVIEIKYNIADKVYVKFFSADFGIRTDFPPFQGYQIIGHLKKFNPDLVYAFFGNNGLEILPVAKKLNVPLFVSFLGIDASTFLNSSFYAKNLKNLFDYAKIVVLSQEMQEKFVKIGCKREKLFVNHLGIPVSKFNYVKRKPLGEKKANGEKIMLLQVSRFFEKKGHSYTIRAFAEALKQYPNLELVLGGDGPLLEPMQKLAEDLGISDKINFVGKVSHSDVITLMEKADIFVHHSITASNGDQEGTPTAILEAMATGLPVIATLHAGIPEQVIEGKTGFLVKEKDVASYSQKIIDLLDQDSEQLGMEARKHIIGNFNIETEVNNLVTFFYQ